jgi:hypothetical protein
MEEKREIAKVLAPELNKLALDGPSVSVPFWCSWVPKDMKDKVRLLKAMHGTVAQLADNIGKPITVRHVLAQAIDLVDEVTGECVPSIRIVLIGPDDESYSCVSEYAWKSLQSIGSPNLFGPPPWEPPLTLKCMRYTSSRKRSYFNLEVVP